MKASEACERAEKSLYPYLTAKRKIQDAAEQGMFKITFGLNPVSIGLLEEEGYYVHAVDAKTLDIYCECYIEWDPACLDSIEENPDV